MCKGQCCPSSHILLRCVSWCQRSITFLFQSRAFSERLMPVMLNCCYIATSTDIELESVKDCQINVTCELNLCLLHKLSYSKVGKTTFISFTY